MVALIIGPVNFLPFPNKLPPVAASYQLSVKPAAGPFETVNVEIGVPEQYEAFAEIGAVIGRQLQSGAVTESVPGQPKSVDVNIIFVPAVIPLIVQLFPEVLTTVPAELVNVPAETVTPTDHVNKFAEQATGVVIVIVGVGI